MRELRHGYYACVSYVDALIGKLLKEIDRLKLRQNTLILVYGDHGFHLGEQGLWTKANNFELSTRVPLIVSAPGQSHGKTDALVELVDVFPTVCELAGLTPPAGLEGVSLLPLFSDPGRKWKTAVFSQYPRSLKGNRHSRHGDVMGYSLRTKRYRYVEWQSWKTKAVVARELYDRHSDPVEMRNVADEAQARPVVDRLAKRLAKGWKSALPK